jgi:hypothetical protein
MPVQLFTSISYRDFTGKDASEQEFEQRLARFSLRQVLRLCSTMNGMLRQGTGAINNTAHRVLVKLLFPPTKANLILEQKNRYIFHRQTVLFLAQSALLYCHGQEINLSPEDFHELGLLFMMGSDLVPASMPPSTNDLERCIRFVVHFVGIQEHTVFNDFKYKMSRSFVMASETYRKLSDVPGYVDIEKQFEINNGLALADFFALMIGTLTRFMNFDEAQVAKDPLSYAINSQWFRKKKIPIEKVDIFLEELSATPEDTAAEVRNRHYGPNDFTAFRKKPFFVDGENLFPIDFDFIAEKTETTIYWNILSKLPKERQQSFQSFWGAVFEQYIVDLLLTSSDQQFNSVHRSPKFVGKLNEELCDILVLGDQAAVLIECKGSMFKAEAKYKGNISILESEIVKKFVENKGKPEGVGQLARAVEKIGTEGLGVCQGVSLHGVKTLFPLLITRDDITGIVGVNKYLNERFQRLLPNKKKYPISVAPLICAPSDVLEYWSSYLFEVPLSKFLSSHLKSQANVSDPLLRLARPLPPFVAPDPLLRKLGPKKGRLAIELDKLMKISLELLGLEAS